MTEGWCDRGFPRDVALATLGYGAAAPTPYKEAVEAFLADD